MAPTLEESITAIKESRPPVTDGMTYLTIVESHLSPELLPTLNDVLQDVDLCQTIGWDLIHMLMPVKGSEECLKTIARLGNPREVILQVTEALRLLRVEEEEEEDDEAAHKCGKGKEHDETPPEEVRFVELVNMLAVLHPRIKTKFPSRFLSTSLMAILSAYRPNPQSTFAVLAFTKELSGEKRPALPTRKSSLSMHNLSLSETKKGEKAPDPEAAAEDPKEAAIQGKLLQSFLTHILELYAKEYLLEWSPRLLEHYRPEKVVKHHGKSRREAYESEPVLQEYETILGQIVALAKDLDLSNANSLLTILTAPSTSGTTTPANPADASADDFSANSPDDVPLSKAGVLFLLTSKIFSSTLFSTSHVSLPDMTLFPTYSTILQKFIGRSGVENTGSEEEAVIDSLLAIGLWLEHNDKFVAGPLEDEEFLQLLQSLSLISANCHNEKLRYAAHVLCGNILHSHPSDKTRLTFISDTLEHCPFESLRASAVGWLKEELMTSYSRSTPATPPTDSRTPSPQHNAFASPAALSVLQPYLFPYESLLAVEPEADLFAEFQRSFVFHMAALSFLIFIAQWEGAAQCVPEGMLSIVDEVYLEPLRTAVERMTAIVGKEGGEGSDEFGKELPEGLRKAVRADVEFVRDRIQRCEEVGVGK